jgi:uncharacterized membrane protein
VTANHFWAFCTAVSAVLYAAGLGGVMSQVFRAWHNNDLRAQMYGLTSAADAEPQLLLPGALLTGACGFVWATVTHNNFFKEPWLLTLTVLYLLNCFVLLPLLGMGLRRARLASLKSWKSGKLTQDLQVALSDNVPLVFGSIMLVLVPIMLWLAVFRPFS